MKRKAIVPLVLGLAIGLLAVKFFVDTIRKAKATGQNQRNIKVVLAKADIGAFDEIKQDMVELTETTEGPMFPPGDRISDLQGAIGRVTGKAIPKGSPVLVSMLAPAGTPPGLTGRIPTGFRASSVKIDEASSVAYQIKPGVWVDVLVVMDLDTGRGRKKETISEVILQRVQVAAIGYEAGAETDKNLKVKPAKSATLLVPEEEVPKLHLASTRGKITLALRGDEDTTKTAIGAAAYMGDAGFGGGKPAQRPEAPKDTGAANLLSQMLASSQAPAPKAPPEPEPTAVMIFHGSGTGVQATTMEQITFEGPKSSKIVEMSQGGPSRAAATLRGTQGTPRASGSALPSAMPAITAPVAPQPTLEPEEPSTPDDEAVEEMDGVDEE